MKAYNSFYNRRCKRVIGFVFAIPFTIIAIPLYIFIAIAILIEDGPPVFYRPLRGGYKNKPFKMYKFRTMVKNADQIGGGTTAMNDSRITKVGVVLRKTKLDETANLINIIMGTMSFVGPRPELLQYTAQYVGREREIFEVRPGVTDYSSLEYINLDEIVGSDNADEIYEKRILQRKNELRIQYAETVGFCTDIAIFFKTIRKVLYKAYCFINKPKRDVEKARR